MAVKCDDIIKFMNEMFPEYLAEDFDNVGLLVGDRNSEVKKILIALDCIDDVVDEAIEKSADMIITHHPMIFKPLKKINSDTNLGKRVIKLIKNDISLYSAHTNLDIAKGGTNDILCDILGLKNIALLHETGSESLKKIVVYVPLDHAKEVREAMCKAGAGFIGNYSDCTFSAEGIGTFTPRENTNPYIGSYNKTEEVKEIRLESVCLAKDVKKVIAEMEKVHPYEEVAYDIFNLENKHKPYGLGRIGDLEEEISFYDFADKVKGLLGLSNIRVIGDFNKKVKKVALCTGSGFEFFSDAVSQKADCYITADIKFHDAQRILETNVCVIDATHYASENIFAKRLKEVLLDKFPDTDIVVSEVDGQTFKVV